MNGLFFMETSYISYQNNLNSETIAEEEMAQFEERVYEVLKGAKLIGGNALEGLALAATINLVVGGLLAVSLPIILPVGALIAACKNGKEKECVKVADLEPNSKNREEKHYIDETGIDWGVDRFNS